MKIVENGLLGLRAAILRMRSQDAACRYVLYPMLHIGEARYYREVAHALADCDHILIEGVKHPVASKIVNMFEALAVSPRFRLVAQREMATDLSPLRDRILNIDVPAQKFGVWWRQQTFWMRYVWPVLARIMIWYVSRFWDRRRLAKEMELDLSPTRESILRMSIESDFSKLVVNRRDKHILTRLDAFHADHRDHSCKVAIVFGAGHMRAIIRHLVGAHGYHVSEGSWITIFGWDMPEAETIAN